MRRPGRYSRIAIHRYAHFIRECLVAGFRLPIPLASLKKPGDRNRGSSSSAIILAVMLARKDRRRLELVGQFHGYHVISAHSWTEALSELDAHVVSVLIVHRKALGSDWRDLLNFFLLPIHHCCVILASETMGDGFCEEILEGGGYGVLQTPLTESTLSEMIQLARAHWSKSAALAYGY